MTAHDDDGVTLPTCASLSLLFRLTVPREAAAECSELYDACRIDTATADGVEDFDVRSLFRSGSGAHDLVAVMGVVDAAAIERSRDDMVIVHASAVDSPNGPVLLVGPSGAGKSSLSAALTAAGWSYAGDEAIGIDRSGMGMVANPKPWKLDGPARAALEPFGVERRLDVPADIETLLAPCAVGRCLEPGPMLAPVAVAHVEFCPGAPVDVAPLARADVAELLVTQCFNFARLGGVALDALAHIGRTVPGVHLRFGTLTDAVATVQELVA